MIRKSRFLAGISLLLAILACSIPGTTPTLSVDQQAATIIAATLQAQAENGGDVPITPTPSITRTITALSTATSATRATITPTYSTPMLTVLEQTNCREGPGQDYPINFTYLANVELEIIGRYEPTNFWLVKAPESRSGTCWLWGEYVELSGSYWVVPSVTPPATATIAPPPAASLQNWVYDCSGGQMTITIEWEDRATDEIGYRILRNGEPAMDLAPNTQEFTESIALTDETDEFEYQIQVFGPGGTANTYVAKFSC